MQDTGKGLWALLTARAGKVPDKPLLGGDKWLSTEEVRRLTERAAALFRKAGLCDGVHAALSCAGNVNTAIVLLALRAAGAVVVLLDPRQDVQDALAGAETPIPVKVVIAQTTPGVFRISWCRSTGKAEESFALHSLPAAEGVITPPDPGEPAFIIFTSGSTGKNKAVVHTESSVISNLVDAQPFGDYREDDVALASLPFHHVFGLVLLLGTIILGYSAYFPGKTDVPGLLSAIQAQRITRMNGVPSLYLAMADMCGGYDLTSLRAGFVGGSPIAPAQFTAIEARLGMTLIPVYGMSECISISIASWQDPPAERAGGNGRFYPRTAWKLLRPDGAEAAPGEEGEIHVNGPSRMVGYYGSPLPAEAMIPTGDLGYVDPAGVLHLTGRIKDILIRNGNNLSPARIEQALLALPGVREAVVVGLPDERQGEVPAAMVVADDDSHPLAPRLPKNELPALYVFVPQLPLTASGKPDRMLIRQQLLEHKYR